MYYIYILWCTSDNTCTCMHFSNGPFIYIHLCTNKWLWTCIIDFYMKWKKKKKPRTVKTVKTNRIFFFFSKKWVHVYYKIYYISTCVHTSENRFQAQKNILIKTWKLLYCWQTDFHIRILFDSDPQNLLISANLSQYTTSPLRVDINSWSKEIIKFLFIVWI